jgi:hypothetical protein
MSTEDFQASHLVEQDSTQESPLLIPGGLFIVFEGIDGTGMVMQ